MIIKTLKTIKKPFVLILLLAILFFSYLLTRGEKEIGIRVVNTIPPNEESDVLITSNILVEFDKVLPEENRERVVVNIVPATPHSILWKTNSLEIRPSKPLKPSATYEISILVDTQKEYSFSFETSPFSLEQIQREGSLQSKDDIDYGKAYISFLKEYPWYHFLPIETKEYRIFYDFEERSFRIRLLVAPQTDKEREWIVNKALESLIRIGVEEPVPHYVLDPVTPEF